ncbi:LOB domain-containing protein 33-like [Abrus precatorius]|uniref:LOB domain-containing protein 33-like n=1 Tax=Abrus precatorius TaxID=3816 RepID=A0A8B8MLL2_ABRPR|nr:LOB domain-containing protein 33-like [Abrus precatorius]
MTGFSSSCGACKFLRRKCTRDCVFAPYFSYDEAPTHFAAVHKIYGASNVSKLLSHLPIHNRSDAAITISYEALARMQDPIYGCVAHIYALQQQVASLQEEIDTLGSLMANSKVSVVNCGSVQPPMNSNNGIHSILQHDDTRTQYYQNQMANFLSQEGSATVYQSLDKQMDIELPNVHGFEESSFGDCNPNPLEQFLSGIDQEVFMNHPWFKHNANIKN